MNGFDVRRGFAALNKVVLPLVQAGLGSPPPVGVGVVVLETTGRVSGRTRQVPVVAIRCGDTMRVSTVRAESQWLANAQADGRTAVWLHGRRRPTTATVRRGPLNTVELLADPRP